MQHYRVMNNNNNIYSYNRITNIKYNEYLTLTTEQIKIIKKQLQFFIKTLSDNLNKSFDFVNHQNLKNCYLSLDEEHKQLITREKQFIKRQKFFHELYKCFKCYRAHLTDETDKDNLKELFKMMYSITLTHVKLTIELYEEYYFKLNTIYFKEEIPYNYKTLAEFFLEITEFNNSNPSTFNSLINDFTEYNIDYDPPFKDPIKNNIDLDITEDKYEADFYQDNKSYATAYNILDLINKYDKLPTKLKTKFKNLAEFYNIKPLYNKNYFLNSLENKFYYISFKLKKTDNIHKLYRLYPHYETTYLMYEQNPSLYEPPQKNIISYFHNFNYREEYEEILLGH